MLAERDPAAAARVHPNDRRRVVRALELTEAGPRCARRHRLWSEHTRHPTLVFGLDVPPDELERRIERRARAMFDRGRVEEARAALAGGISRDGAPGARPARARDAAAGTRRSSAIVARTRRYAAYQRKWMRRIPGIVSGRRRPPGRRRRRCAG